MKKIYKTHHHLSYTPEEVNYENVEKWLSSTSKPTEREEISEDNLEDCDVRIETKWVYGIRNKDVKYFV